MVNQLLIRVTKGKPGKPDTLTCRRPDGSTTWGRCPGPGLHDLIHYAVESVLSLQHSFYGLVAAGHAISDFATPGAAKAVDLPLEAGQTEFVVGLLQTELAMGAPFDDLVQEVRSTCAAAKTEPPGYLRHEQVPDIRAAVRRLQAQWATTRPGEFMEMTLDLAESLNSA